MQLIEMIEKVKRHPNADRIGMILSHTGIVRGSSRDGRPVDGLVVAVDHERLAKIVEREKLSSGIVEVLVEIVEDTQLQVGDEIMRLVVAGDVREHVIETLERTLNAIKATVTSKTERFVQG